MKRTFLYTSILVLVALTVLYCSDDQQRGEETEHPEQQQQAITSCMSFGGEAVLNLDGHVLEVTEGRKERGLFHNKVHSTDALYVLDTLICEVSYQQLCSLKTLASDLVGVCTMEHITGLRVFYGLTPDYRSFRATFQPVKLCKTAANGHLADFDISHQGGYYHVDASNGNFITSSTTLMQADTARYRDKIRIRHFGSTNPTGYQRNATNDSLSDSRSILFSFQEIEALAKANTYPQYIKMWNSLRKIKFASSPDSVYKHSIFMGPSALGLMEKEVFYAADYRNKYANLAHMCPANCVKLVFILQ
jgi:hypothetical protein